MDKIGIMVRIATYIALVARNVWDDKLIIIDPGEIGHASYLVATDVALGAVACVPAHRTASPTIRTPALAPIRVAPAAIIACASE
jgi:hypothetical protein